MVKKSIPAYEGKPTAYLDHNILDLLVKNPEIGFKNELSRKFQILYSDENLKEIKRTGENGFLYLQALRDIKAIHIKIMLNSSFEFTGDAFLRLMEPADAYNDYCQNIEPVYEHIEKSTSQSIFKFFGGRRGDNFDDINNEELDAFDDLINHIRYLANNDEIQENLPELGKNIIAYTSELKRSYSESLRISTQELRKHTPDEQNYSGVNEYRDITGIGPVQLNNIEPPNVLEKIWEAHKDLSGYAGHDFTIEQFYGINFNSIYNREMFLFEKITSIYNVLNVIGYFPDSKMKN